MEEDEMADDVLESIQALAHEEHELREREARAPLSGQDAERLAWLETRLDQCWDLLRQRRGLAGAGRDPEEATPRSVDTVEHYQQ
jgi:hypothetical protein